MLAGKSISAALASLNVHEDFNYSKPEADTTLWFVHRQLANGDLYFVNNRQPRAESVEVSFRVTGRAPELWHADTGRIEPASYRIVGERTIVPLHLESADAVFVVFRHQALQAQRVIPELLRTPLLTLGNPWSVSFQSERGAPAGEHIEQLSSWTKSAEPGIKYFSGTATYRQSLPVPASWFHTGQRLELDLGVVKNLAQVSLNGQSLGMLWKAPFRIDVTSVLHTGANQIEIQVTNLWPNRMIGDKQPGARAIAFSTFDPYQADSSLLESGLLGPVSLVGVRGAVANRKERMP